MTKELIGDIADVQTGPFGSQLHKEDYVKDGTPIVTVEHLGQRKMTRQNLPCVKEEDKERLSKYELNTGDLVFSRVGSVDRCSYVSEEENEWLFSGRCLRVRCNHKVYPKYLYYYFNLETVKQYIRNIAVGATMPSINTKLLSEVPVEYPEYDTQKKIADILSLIDDKIELNIKLNANFIEVCKTIYSNYFISCTPFQNVINTEYGLLPHDWRMGQLSELIEVKYGKDHKKLENGDIPVYGSGGVMRFVDTSLYKGESVLIPRKGSLNNVMYVNEEFWSVDTMFYTIMRDKNLAKYVYFIMSSKDLLSMNAGSAVPSMTTDILNKMVVKIPTTDVLKEFEEKVSSMFEIIKNNTVQNLKLSTLRDTILTRMMSCELELSDIELDIL